MPAGTCEICGCTGNCEPRCHFVANERRHCSQCVGWVRFQPREDLDGIVPYDLWPVRTLVSVPDPKLGRVWPVDTRRISEEAMNRLAFVVGPICGLTAQDFLDETTGNKEPFVLLDQRVLVAVAAPGIERAAAIVEEYLEKGSVASATMLAIGREGRCGT